MTPWEKLLWLQEHAHETSIEINPHRGVYESPREYMSKPEPDEDDKAIVDECERRGVLVTVQCYTHTPISFYRQPHWDLAEAISMIYELARRDIEGSQRQGDGEG